MWYGGRACPIARDGHTPVSRTRLGNLVLAGDAEDACVLDSGNNLLCLGGLVDGFCQSLWWTRAGPDDAAAAERGLKKASVWDSTTPIP